MLEDAEVRAVREVVRQDLIVPLGTHGTDNANIGRLVPPECVHRLQSPWPLEFSVVVYSIQVVSPVLEGRAHHEIEYRALRSGR